MRERVREKEKEKESIYLHGLVQVDNGGRLEIGIDVYDLACKHTGSDRETEKGV